MASIYIDAVREEKYAANRQKKHFLERCFFWTSIAIYIYIIFGVAAKLIAGSLNIASFGFLRPLEDDLITGIVNAAVAAAALYTCYKRTNRAALISLGVAVAANIYLLGVQDFTGSPQIDSFWGGLDVMMLVICIVLLVLSKQWTKLSQEEGFPLFDVSFQEMEEQKALREKRTRYQATQLHHREERLQTAPVAEEMADLLDHAPVLPEAARLREYHERCRNSVPENVAAESYTEGVMTALEEIAPNLP